MRQLTGLCSLCGNDQFSSARMNLVGCKACGCILDSKIWRASANLELEEEWFEQRYNLNLSFWVKMFEAWHNRQTIRSIINFTQKKGGKLLEIGVGSGSFLNSIRRKGFDVTGCDLSKTLSRHVERTYGIPVHNGFVSSLPSDPHYDVIVMNHVLEHVNDPISLLKDIRSRLKQDGLLHLAVPNVASWEAALPGWASYEPYHLVYFTPETLRKTLESAGFKVIRLVTRDSFSGWFLAIIRTLLRVNSKDRGRYHSIPKGRRVSWIEHFYRFAMVSFGIFSFPLRYLQAHLGFGDEIVILAQP